MREHKQIESGTFKGLPVNAGPGEKAQTEILERIHEVQVNYLDRHNRAYGMMLHIRYPNDGNAYPEGNRLFNRFLHNFITDRKRQQLDPKCVWCTEKNSASDSCNVHHHVYLLLDGSKTQLPHKHVERANELWSKALGIEGCGGLVNYGTKNEHGDYGHMIKREDQKAFEEAFYHASYLAKVNTKDGVPEGMRHFGSSHTKSRLQSDNQSK